MGGVFLPVDRFTAGDLTSVCDKTEQAGRQAGWRWEGLIAWLVKEKVKGGGPGKTLRSGRGRQRRRAGPDEIPQAEEKESLGGGD